jgi:hypothetical protein
MRPVDKRKLRYRPKALKAKIGSVTVPETDAESDAEPVPARVPRDHTEMQWLLLNLVSDMGSNIRVARNDKGKSHKGKRFSALPNMKKSLPLQFDDATNRTIELIDVLWLQGNAIVAAFEIESTTSIYSGLLRMSDLIAMQPNLNIPLYLVAPEERREKVMTEVNRPTFSKLSPPLYEICRFISFQGLKEQIKRASPYIRLLKPEFLEEISESCELEEVWNNSLLEIQTHVEPTRTHCLSCNLYWKPNMSIAEGFVLPSSKLRLTSPPNQATLKMIRGTL